MARLLSVYNGSFVNRRLEVLEGWLTYDIELGKDKLTEREESDDEKKESNVSNNRNRATPFDREREREERERSLLEAMDRNTGHAHTHHKEEISMTKLKQRHIRSKHSRTCCPNY